MERPTYDSDLMNVASVLANLCLSFAETWEREGDRQATYADQRLQATAILQDGPLIDLMNDEGNNGEGFLWLLPALTRLLLQQYAASVAALQAEETTDQALNVYGEVRSLPWDTSE